jgi:hypothetical protein
MVCVACDQVKRKERAHEWVRELSSASTMRRRLSPHHLRMQILSFPSPPLPFLFATNLVSLILRWTHVHLVCCALTIQTLDNLFTAILKMYFVRGITVRENNTLSKWLGARELKWLCVYLVSTSNGYKMWVAPDRLVVRKRCIDLFLIVVEDSR